MTALILTMLRARRGQAVALALLALFAVAATVAAPAYVLAVDKAIVRGEVATSTPSERGVVVSAVVDEKAGAGLSFNDFAGALVALPGFTQVFASEFKALGIDPDPADAARVVDRQDVCAHLTMVTGRCTVGPGEVVVGAATARRFHLGAGDPVTLTYALVDNPRHPVYVANGEPNLVTIVGTYRVPDPAELYWGTHGYFDLGGDGRPGEPVFTDAATMTAMDHGAMPVSVDATAGPDTFAPDNLPAVRAQLAGLTARSQNLSQALQIGTGIPQLLDRIDRSRALARDTVPVAAVPLVLLAYVVVFLAAGYGAEGRRPELAVVALRGARWWTRWWLATGESLIAIVLGATAGCLAGQLLVDLVVLGRFPGIDTPWFSLEALRYAPLAALGALAAALLGQRRHVASPVTELLRQVHGRPGRLRLLAGEATVGVLAVLATGQLFLTHGALGGVGLTAPALVVIALAVLAARWVPSLARLAGRRALARGRLAAALAAFQLARRPGAQRLLFLLVAGVGVFGYAVCAVNVTAHDRDVAAEVGIGAPRVLSVATLTREQLLHATRAADPAGSWAMAVDEMPDGAPGEAPKLAVDATRLSTVATWPAGGAPAATVAHELRSAAPAPVVITGQDVTMAVDVAGAGTINPINLELVLSSLAGHGTVAVPFGELRNGPAAFTLRTPACLDGGCRVVGIHLTSDTLAVGDLNLHLTFTVRTLGSINPVAAATGADLTTTAGWRAVAGTLTAGPDGLRLTVSANGLPDGAWIQPIAAPVPLPVVSTVQLPRGATLTGYDTHPAQVRQAGRVTVLPRLGTEGTLVDLEYADRAATDAGPTRQPEVWLGAAAPPDALTRLARQGLIVTGDVDLATARHRLASDGPALAVWFYLLVGVLAIVLAVGGLGIISSIDSRSRTADLAVLRAQGLPSRTSRRAVVSAYPALAVASGVLGLLVALVAWRLTGWALPVFGEDHPPLLLPVWPDPWILLGSWLAATATLVVAALVTSRSTGLSAVARGSGSVAASTTVPASMMDPPTAHPLPTGAGVPAVPDRRGLAAAGRPRPAADEGPADRGQSTVEER
jgi:hypothetical protein